MKQLVWLIILLFIFWYLFAITFTMAASAHLRAVDPGRDRSVSTELGTHFGSVSNSTYSCFKAMTGGQSWGELADPLTSTGKVYVYMFYFYIIFAVLVLL